MGKKAKLMLHCPIHSKAFPAATGISQANKAKTMLNPEVM